jgi:hypothetical protein
MSMALLTSLRPWIQILSALLTPVIGVTTALIAYQQWRVNSTRLRVDLYDRRLAVYRALREHLSQILTSGRVEHEWSLQLLRKTAEADFIFDKDAPRLIKEVYNRSVEMFAVQVKRDAAPLGAEKTRLAEKHAELLKWMMSKQDTSTESFEKYLRIKA